MLRINQCLIALAFSAGAAMAAESGPGSTNEVGFLLGGFSPLSVGGADLGSGIGLQANYGRRIWGTTKVALYGEVHFLASPQRLISSLNRSATRDVASLYVTPGIRVKFLPGARISPYVAVGGGLALYEQSHLSLNGQPNGAERERYTGAFDAAGGADFKLWRWASLRGEVRNFYTGAPAYNLRPSPGAQNNVVIGGGFVVNWH